MFRTGSTRPDSESTALLDLDVHRIHPRKSSFIIKRVVIAALLSARLNLLADQRPIVRDCPATLLHDTLGYGQYIRSLECCACTLGKVSRRAPVSAKTPTGRFAALSLRFRDHTLQ